MGNAFSSLSGCIGKRTNVARQQVSSSIKSMEEDVVSRKDNDTNDTNDIQNEDCPDGENREDDAVLRGESKLSNVMKYRNNVQINNSSNVVIGDNNTITIRQSEQPVTRLLVTKPADDVGFVVPSNSHEEALQISSQAVENITANNPFIAIIGDGNAVNLQLEDNFFQEEASSSEQSARRRLLPLSEPLLLPSAGVEPRIKRVFNIMGGIVNQLYPLRDGGKWQAFEMALNRFHSRYNDPAIKCFLLLEESVKLTYQKRFKEAKRKAKTSFKIVNNEIEGNSISGTLQDVLRVLAKVASASIFRRIPKKNREKALGCLEDAMESSERLRSVNLTMAKFALALLNYEQGRCNMEFATEGDSSGCSREAACRYLGLCIDKCRALYEDKKFYTAKQIFALIYKAHLSLPSGHSEPGQCNTVKKQCARQAEKHLKEYERSHSHLGDYPVAARVKYFMARSEVHILNEEYALAKDCACQAHKIAVEYGFELETAPAQNRVEQISRYWSSTIKQDKLQRAKNLLCGCSSSTRGRI